MKRLSTLAVLILATSVLGFATANASGKLVSPNNSAATPGYAYFQLENCGGNYPEVSGASITPTQKFTLAADGTWSGVLYRNDEIQCNGQSSTWWHLTYYQNGLQVGPARDFICSQATCVFDGTGALTPITTYPVTLPTPPLISLQPKVCAFTNATTWTCVHNFGVQPTDVQFRDLSWKQIYPDTDTATDVNTETATFLQSQSGYMIVLYAGNSILSINNPDYIVGHPNSFQTITGQPLTLTATAPLTSQGNNTFTGSNTFSKLNNIYFADTAGVGADCGAKINYVDATLLGATEGEIWVNQSCGTTWSTAVNLSTNHVLRFSQCGTYNVNTINLAALGNNAIIGAGSKCVILRPLNGSQASIINIAGASIASSSQFITLEGLQLFENFTPGTNADGITSNYAKSVWMRNVTVNGFYDNITLNNSQYLDFYKIRSNGATHRNLFAQWTDTSHGPIFGSNLAVTNSEFDSAAATSDYSVFITDYAGTWFVNNDVTGNGGGGMTVVSINSASDQPAGNMLLSNFFDANASSGLVMNKQRSFTVTNNWFSSGRTNSNDGFTITNSWGGKIANNVAFWCGLNGFDFNGGNANFTIAGNESNANTGDNFRFIGQTNSTISGNASLAHIINGQGVTSTRGFNEDNTSSGNTWSANTSTDAGTLWLLSGTNDHRFQDNMLSQSERAGPSGTSGFCYTYNANTDHRLHMFCNNGSGTAGADSTVVTAVSTDTLTNKTLGAIVGSIANSGTGFKHIRTSTTCTTAASVGATCTTGLISWPGTAFADTNYTVACTLGAVTNVPTVVSTARGTSNFSITIGALTAAAATYSEADCIAVHD